MKTNYIYVVMIKAHTGLGKIARAFSHYEYTHIAVSLDPSLTDFITFSRRRHHLPLDAGFMHEYRDYYAFGNHKGVKVKVFRLPVSAKHLVAVQKFIQLCEADDSYRFNLFSMITMPVLHGFPISRTHNCMSFTAKIVALSGAVTLTKPYYRYSIRELDRLLQDYAFFEGNLKKKPSQGYRAYMQHYGLSEIITTGADTIVTLCKRMLSDAKKHNTQRGEYLK